jgi:hypothetical protein
MPPLPAGSSVLFHLPLGLLFFRLMATVGQPIRVKRASTRISRIRARAQILLVPLGSASLRAVP